MISIEEGRKLSMRGSKLTLMFELTMIVEEMMKMKVIDEQDIDFITSTAKQASEKDFGKSAKKNISLEDIEDIAKQVGEFFQNENAD